MSEQDAIALTLDCRGELCPVPVLRARHILKDRTPGFVLTLLCTDPHAELDLRALAAREGHSVEGVEAQTDGVLRIVLRAG